MDDARTFTVWAGGRNFGVISASMADELVVVAVESEWKITTWTKRLPATFFTDSKRRGAATVMEDEGLVVIVEIMFDVLQK